VSEGAANIRAATERDLPAILDIYNYAVVNTGASYDYEPQSLEARQAWFADYVCKGYPVIVFEESERVLGWASYGSFRDRYGYRFTVENSVYVAPDAQGRGIGKALMERLIEIARERGCHAIVAGMDSESLASIRLHEALGFVTVGHLKEVGYKFDCWRDVIFMQLLLEGGA
jgi:L-amino acid N-acyltransferase